MGNIALHPSIDAGLTPAKADFTGGTLKCKCARDAVEVSIASQVAHNHAVTMEKNLAQHMASGQGGRREAKRTRYGRAGVWRILDEQ